MRTRGRTTGKPKRSRAIATGGNRVGAVRSIQIVGLDQPHPDDHDLSVVISLQRPIGRPNFIIEFVRERNRERLARQDHRALLAALTSRERELVRWICEARSNQEIADLSGRAVGTIKNALHTLEPRTNSNSEGCREQAFSGLLEKSQPAGGKWVGWDSNPQPTP